MHLARFATALLAVACLAAAGCSSLRFHNERVSAVRADAKTKSNRVTLTYELWYEGEPVTGLGLDAFRVLEDGIPATSESLAQADTDIIRVPVTLLLDLSYSMYQAKAVDALKNAASKFVTDLEEQGFAVHVQQFASDVRTVGDIGAIPSALEEADESQRWTALYYAVQQALSREGIIVLFSDGADNYSQNHGVSDIREILQSIKRTRRTIHAVGFGNVREENDRKGVNAADGLAAIGEFGSFSFAENKAGLDRIFQDIAKRFRNIYVLDYFSPNLTGDHTLIIEARAKGTRAHSKPLRFSARGLGSADYADDGEMEEIFGEAKPRRAVRPAAAETEMDVAKVLAENLKAPNTVKLHANPQVGQWVEHVMRGSGVQMKRWQGIVGKRGDAYLVEIRNQMQVSGHDSSHTIGLLVDAAGAVQQAWVANYREGTVQSKVHAIGLGGPSQDIEPQGEPTARTASAAGREWACRSYTETADGQQVNVLLADEGWFGGLIVAASKEPLMVLKLEKMGTDAVPSIQFP